MPHVRSDRERKAMFASMSSGHKQGVVANQEVRQQFISRKIRKNIKEGKPRKQAVAIAFSQAREKFGNKLLERRVVKQPFDRRGLSPEKRALAEKGLRKLIAKTKKKRKNPDNDGEFVSPKAFRIVGSKPLITKKPFNNKK